MFSAGLIAFVCSLPIFSQLETCKEYLTDSQKEKIPIEIKVEIKGLTSPITLSNEISRKVLEHNGSYNVELLAHKGSSFAFTIDDKNIGQSCDINQGAHFEAGNKEHTLNLSCDSLYIKAISLVDKAGNNIPILTAKRSYYLDNERYSTWFDESHFTKPELTEQVESLYFDIFVPADIANDMEIIPVINMSAASLDEEVNKGIYPLQFSDPKIDSWRTQTPDDLFGGVSTEHFSNGTWVDIKGTPIVITLYKDANGTSVSRPSGYELWREKINQIKEGQLVDIQIPLVFVIPTDASGEDQGLFNISESYLNEMVKGLNDLYAQKGVYRSENPNSTDTKIQFYIKKIAKLNVPDAITRSDEGHPIFDSDTGNLKHAVMLATAINEQAYDENPMNELYIWMTIGDKASSHWANMAGFAAGFHEHAAWRSWDIPLSSKLAPLIEMSWAGSYFLVNTPKADVFLNYTANTEFTSLEGDSLTGKVSILAHEIGHHLALQHTFSDCGYEFGDFVSDTPKSDNSQGIGCDGNHYKEENLMSYAADSTVITLEQAKRMQITSLLSMDRVYSPFHKWFAQADYKYLFKHWAVNHYEDVDMPIDSDEDGFVDAMDNFPFDPGKH